ncbi:hypothetical protein [Acinetobacter soli]|uniref:hypothetical protein n=1 Tax=Acinetobacter soli TaxID=487316 RepID=UPI0032B5575B
MDNWAVNMNSFFKVNNLMVILILFIFNFTCSIICFWKIFIKLRDLLFILLEFILSNFKFFFKSYSVVKAVPLDIYLFFTMSGFMEKLDLIVNDILNLYHLELSQVKESYFKGENKLLKLSYML